MKVINSLVRAVAVVVGDSFRLKYPNDDKGGWKDFKLHVIEAASSIGAPVFTIPPAQVEAPQTLEIYGGIDRSPVEPVVAQPAAAEIVQPVKHTTGLPVPWTSSPADSQPAETKVYKQPAAKLPKDGKRGKSKRAYRQAGLAALELEDISRNE